MYFLIFLIIVYFNFKKTEKKKINLDASGGGRNWEEKVNENMIKIIM